MIRCKVLTVISQNGVLSQLLKKLGANIGIYRTFGAKVSNLMSCSDKKCSAFFLGGQFEKVLGIGKMPGALF